MNGSFVSVTKIQPLLASLFYSDQLFSKERQVTMMKEDLDSASNRFSNAESKCMKQRAEMAAKEE